MVMSPPPPKPVKALMRTSMIMLDATAQPRHPSMKVTVDTKKHTRLPKMSEKRPYSGWKAVLVMRYDVVSQAALLAALKSELIKAYVEAVMVPSKPDRKTLAQSAGSLPCQSLPNSQLPTQGICCPVTPELNPVPRSVKVTYPSQSTRIRGMVSNSLHAMTLGRLCN